MTLGADSSRTRIDVSDREAIEDVLRRYSRAVDRCDLPLLKSVYWEDATEGHGIFTGNAIEYSEMIIPFLLKTCVSTMHAISNVSAQIHLAAAKVETYVVAYHFLKAARHIGPFLCNEEIAESYLKELPPAGEDEPCDLVVGGRYLDRFTKRGGEWRIQARELAVDWSQTRRSDMLFHRPTNVESPLLLGLRNRSDRSYWLFDHAALQ